MRSSSTATSKRLAPQTLARPLVLVDSQIQNYQGLIEGVAPGSEIVILAADRDGIEQITAALQGTKTPLRSLHLISHGAPGQLFVGNSVLSTASLPQYEAQISRWRDFLAKDADIVIYGCEVAAETAIAAPHPLLLQQLQSLIGGTLYASRTPTGHRHQGGDWQFDFRLGDRASLPAPNVIQPATQRHWPGLLNEAPFIGDQPYDLYDTGSGATPADDTTVPNGPALSFTNLALDLVPMPGNATETFTVGATQLNTIGDDSLGSTGNGIYAGYSNYNSNESNENLINPSLFPPLDRTQGYLINFALKVNAATNTDLGSDKNLDGLPDRAGFSVIAISSDGQLGIELGFETNRIWAQEDGTGQLDPALEPDPLDSNTSDRTLFTQAEGVDFATNNSLVNYSLLVQGTTYTLYADGVDILSGNLRDYTAFDGQIDPYDNSNFLFFGDNTPSARGRVDIGDISVVTAADSATYTAAFEEAIHQGNGDTDGVLIASNPIFADIDGDAIESITVTLTSPPTDTGERLFLTGTFSNVDYTLDADSQITVTNTGGATPEEMAAAIAAIRYQNNDDTPTTGDRTINLEVSDGAASSLVSATVSVSAVVAGIPTILINEIDANTPGSDTAEFIELYDGGVGNTALDGLVVVLFNGNSNAAYEAFDLDGFSTDADGYFLLGNAAIAEPGGLVFDDGTLQNGSDAVALYAQNGDDFPLGTGITTTNLIDAIVYGSGTTADEELEVLLNGGTFQADENANNQSATQSLQRLPNGTGGPLNSNAFIAATPSPGLGNAAIIEFASDTFVVAEAGGDSAVIELTRSLDIGESTITVSFSGGSASGSSTGTADYDTTGFPLTVTFAEGETSQQVAIPIVDDITIEGDETVELTLSSPTNAFIGNQSTAVLTITDDDTAGFAIAASDDDTTIDETGNLTDTLTVVLTSQPLTDVVLTVVSSDTEEVTVDTPTLTFTPETWNQPQTVTVTGVDDVILDGDQTSTLAIAVDPAASDDAFDGLAIQTVTVTTTDDDVAGFSIKESEGNTTVDELGATDTFTVVLDHQPLSTVQLTVTSDNPETATIDQSLLTFTPETWDQPQTVTVTGVNDDVADGPQTSAIAISVDIGNSDSAFANVDAQTVAVTTNDDDTAGVSVVPTEGTTAIIEGETTDSYTIVLDSQPVDDVTLTLFPSEQVSLVPSSPLTFTPDNWNVPQTVTVTAVDDDAIEGPHSGTISHTATSNDENYDGITIADLSVAITDNDVAAIALTESGATTAVTEGGATDSYDIVLTAIPTADVVIEIATPDGETSLSPSPLIFTPDNWNVAQTVIITATDDSLVEGEHTGIITHTVSSDDPEFDGLSIEDITVAISDNDSPGFSITESDGMTSVSETGTNDTFEVTLASQPQSDVVLTVESDNPAAAIATPTTLTFTPDNWNVAQTVTVTGQDDGLVDGPELSTITLSVDAAASDAAFAGLNPQTVSVLIADDDVAGFSITPTEGDTTVSETGTSDTFAVVLDSQPIDTVELTVSSSDSTEVAVAPTTLTFTPDTWNMAQTVTVTGVDDDTVDGPQSSSVVVSVNAANSAAAFADVAAQTVTVTTTDDDVAGVTFTESNDTTTVIEGGTTDSYTVKLDTQPTAPVTIALSSDGKTTLSPSSLTFTPENWNQAQTVTVTAVNDEAVEGEHTSTITHTSSSDDTAYDALMIPDVTVAITDNDSIGFTLNETNGNTKITEAGGADSYTLALNSQPTGDVTVTLSPDDQITLNKTTFLFTQSNWNLPQTVVVSAVDDDKAEGLHTGTISHSVSSSDPDYDGVAIADVTTTITDNDTATIVITESNGTTLLTEDGASDGYSVFLASQPTDTVTIELLTDDQVSVSETTLTFTPDNWNIAQNISIAAIDDPTVEGPHTGLIDHIVSSTDPQYNGVDLAAVTASITDNDIAGFTVTPSAAIVSEDGAVSASLRLTLTGEPLSPVVLNIDNPAPDEVNLGTSTITLDSSNWDTGVDVSIQGLNDDVVDGDQTTALTVSVVATSSDDAFAALDDQTVTITTTDTNTAALLLSTATATVSEAGTTDSYTIALTSRPTAEVVITFDGGDQLATPDPITFTPETWDIAQTVTIAALDDDTYEGKHTGPLTQTVSSNDENFDGIAVTPIAVEILDNDAVGTVLSTTTGTVSEAGETDSYTVALTSRPTANVTLTFDGGDQLVTPAPLTFTPDNWDTAQTVTLTALDDAAFEGAHTGTLTQRFSSQDSNYDGLAIAPINVTIADNDRPANLVFTFDQFVTFQAIDEGILPSFDEELYLLANPDVAAAIQRGELASGAEHYNLFGQAEGRSLLPLNLEIGGLRMADFYDETFYLNQNQDVAEAVSQGAFANGYEHFLRFGLAEGRNPSYYYNEDVYLAANPDVARAIDNGTFTSGLAHYLEFGHLEDRIASLIFDAEDYLLQNQDVNNAVRDGAFLSAFEHFLEAGAQEGRLPVLLFEEFTYRQRNPDIARAVANNELSSGFVHYVSFGQQERRDPSTTFDESAYLDANPDVARAVSSGNFSSGMEHYFRFGRAEERPLV